MAGFVSFSATALLPGYMGWAHISFIAFLIYAAVAGATLTAAERFTSPFLAGYDVSQTARHAALQCRYVLIIGGAIYLLALLLI